MLRMQAATYRPPTQYRGLGSQQSAQEALSYASAGASVAVGAAAAAGLIPVAAVPIIGPAIAAAAILASILIRNSGCGITCIQTSQWADQAAGLLQQNSDAYFALPVPRARSNQALALQTVDQIFAQLAKLCGAPAEGDAGKRCISDRLVASACTWRQNRSGGHPGEPAMGECWNWVNGYRDPIANDPDTYDDTAGGFLPAGLPSVDGITPAVWLPVLAIAVGVALL